MVAPREIGLSLPIGLRFKILRVGLVGIGAAAIIWSALAFPTFWAEASIDHVAAHIIMGEKFRSEVLKALDAEASLSARSSPSPARWLRSVAVIKLRRAELALESGNQTDIQVAFASLDQSIQRTLLNAPSESFLWLTLFWSQNTSEGFRLDHLDFLKMSYLCGAHEGWVAARRNRFAIALFPQLSRSLAVAALTEFRELVASDYINEAAQILVGPGWRIRDQLLDELMQVPEYERQSLANKVYDLGYDVTVPGIEPRRDRP